jgi:hypothetical protein
MRLGLCSARRRSTRESPARRAATAPLSCREAVKLGQDLRMRCHVHIYLPIQGAIAPRVHSAVRVPPKGPTPPPTFGPSPTWQRWGWGWGRRGGAARARARRVCVCGGGGGGDNPGKVRLSHLKWDLAPASGSGVTVALLVGPEVRLGRWLPAACSGPAAPQCLLPLALRSVALALSPSRSLRPAAARARAGLGPGRQ